MQEITTSPIRAARELKGLTQEQLAGKLGVTKSAISGWESGAARPETARLAGLRRALRPHFNVLAYLEHVEAIERAGVTS